MDADDKMILSHAQHEDSSLLEGFRPLLSNANHIRKRILKQFSSKKKISEVELKKAKEFMKGHLVMELEDSQSVSIYYSMQHVLQNNIKNPDEALKKIDSITVEDIQKVAKKYFTEKGLNLAVIGNFGKDKKTENANRQRFEKLLKL